MKGVPLLLALTLFMTGADADDLTIKTGTGIYVTGSLKSRTEEGIVMEVSGREIRYTWDDLAPGCSYELQKELVPESDAPGHFRLGEFCLRRGLMAEAKEQFDRAIALDPSCRQQAEALLQKAEEEKKSQPTEPPAVAPTLPQGLVERKKPVSEPPSKPEAASEKGEVSQEEIVEAQKEYLQKVTEAMKLPFTTVETKHYLVHCTFNRTVARQIASLCEDLYSEMSKVFDVKRRDTLWYGKCMVFAFENPRDFVRFAKDFDEFPEAEKAGGYFTHQGRLVHICIPKMAYNAEKHFQSTLVHEGAHAFLQLFKDVVRISPWIHEGVAQYFEHLVCKSGSEWNYKRMAIDDKHHLELLHLASTVRGKERLLGNDLDGYAYSWSAVDFMIKKNPRKFVKFILALKDGASEEEALKQGFGWTMDEFDKAWVTYVKKAW